MTVVALTAGGIGAAVAATAQRGGNGACSVVHVA
jgi:hypothetical protein